MKKQEARLTALKAREAAYADPAASARANDWLATMLAHRLPLTDAVRMARAFTFAAIENAPGFGAGHGPLGHQAVRRLAEPEAD